MLPPLARQTTFAGLGAQVPNREDPMRIRRIAIFISVRRRARHSAALDRRGAILPPAILSPAILSALLAVSTGVAVLRGGRRARCHRNNRHRTDPADHGCAALRLLRAALLPTNPSFLPTAKLF